MNYLAEKTLKRLIINELIEGHNNFIRIDIDPNTISIEKLVDICDDHNNVKLYVCDNIRDEIDNSGFELLSATNITQLRNQTNSDDKIVIYGNAKGHSESGLLDAKLVVDTDHWFDDFIRCITDSIDHIDGGAQNDIKPTIFSIIRSLITVMNEKAFIEKNELIQFFNQTLLLSDFESGLSNLKDKLIEEVHLLGLLNDPQLGDVLEETERIKRIRNNLEIVSTLRDDSKKDTNNKKFEKYLEREPEDSYVNSLFNVFKDDQILDNDSLKDLNLNDAKKVFKTRGGGPSRRESTISFISALNESYAKELVKHTRSELPFENIVDKLDQLNPFKSNINFSYTDEDGDDVVKISFNFYKDEILFNDVPPMLNDYLDADLNVENITDRLTSEKVKNDILCGHYEDARTLFEEYISNRERIKPYTYYTEFLPQIIILYPKIKEYFQDYLSSWESFSNKIKELKTSEQNATQAIAVRHLAKIDVVREGSTSVRLMPTHPFIIKPLLNVIREVEKELEQEGESGIGDKLEYSLKMSIPYFGLFYYDYTPHSFSSGTIFYPRFLSPEVKNEGPFFSSNIHRSIVLPFSNFHPYVLGRDKRISIKCVDPPENFTKKLDNGNMDIFCYFSEKKVDYTGESTEGVRKIIRCNDRPELIRELKKQESHLSFYFLKNNENLLRMGGFDTSVGTDLEFAFDRITREHSLKICSSDKENNPTDYLHEITNCEYDYNLPLDTSKEDNGLITALGKNSAWVITASRTTSATIPPKLLPYDSNDNKMHYLGSETIGNHFCNIYARSMYAIKYGIESLFSSYDVGPINNDFLERFARSVPKGLMKFSSKQTTEAKEAIGLSGVLKNFQNKDNIILLSMDSIEWTKYWLPKGKRCDIIAVKIIDENSIELIMIESKGTAMQHDALINASDPVYAKGITQVKSTYDALNSVLSSNQGNNSRRIKIQALQNSMINELVARFTDRQSADHEYDSITKYIDVINKLGDPDKINIKYSGCVYKTTLSSIRDQNSSLTKGDLTIQLYLNGKPTLMEVWNHVIETTVDDPDELNEILDNLYGDESVTTEGQEIEDTIVEPENDLHEDQTEENIDRTSELILGKTVHDEMIRYDIDVSRSGITNQHILLFGSSGAGKTHTIKILLSHLHKNDIPTLIFDFKDDYVQPEFYENIDGNLIDVFEHGVPLNPLALIPSDHSGEVRWKDVVSNTHNIVDIFNRVHRLGEQQQANLRNGLYDLYTNHGITKDSIISGKSLSYPPFDNIGEFIEDTKLMNKLSPYTELEIFSGKDSIDQFFINKTSIFKFTNLPSDNIKKSTAEFLLRELYRKLRFLGHSDALQVAVVVDEAHRIANLDSISLLLREARAYGASVILGSQFLNDFDEDVSANASTKIVLKVLGENDSKSAGKILAGTDYKSMSNKLKELKRGQAYIKNDVYSPFKLFQVRPNIFDGN